MSLYKGTHRIAGDSNYTPTPDDISSSTVNFIDNISENEENGGGIMTILMNC